MYNLYTQEKQLNEERDKKKEEETRRRYKEKRKKVVKAMYENYENRVKNFITDMTHPNHTIIIQDNPKIANSRAVMMNERGIMKSFVFKGYKTEKDRIADTLKNNIYLFSEDRSPNSKGLYKSTNGSTIFNGKNKRGNIIADDTIIQPEMRFKPRTDLERVFDAINGNYLKDNDRQILNRQLQLLDLLTFRKPSSSTLKALISNITRGDQDLEDPLLTAINTESNKASKKSNKKEILAPRKPWVRRLDLNTEAKGILSDYHYKTHFKAAEEIAEGKIVVQTKKSKNFFDDQMAPPSSPKISCFKSGSINSSSLKIKKRNKDYSFDHSFEDNNELNSLMSYDNYDMNTNPLISKQYDKLEPGQMNQLSRLAFTQPKEEDDNTNIKKNVSFSENNNTILKKKFLKPKIAMIDDNNVYIDNELYNKNTQLDVIASKVLNKCNMYHNKSMHNNTSLKKLGGKLMFTNGMTVSQFAKKYNLQ